MQNILIVDDDLFEAKAFGKFIGKMDHNVIYIDKGQEAIDFFTDKKTISGVHSSQVDIVLLDISMPDVDGLKVLERIAKIKDNLQIIIITSYKEINITVSAIRLGAFDYVVKGEKDFLARIETSVSNAIEKINLKYQVSFSERSESGQVLFSDLVGSSKSFLDAVDLAKKACNHTIPILIEGQVGVGKEFLAKAIHGSSLKAGMPFVSLDCAKLTPENACDIMFGYKRISASGKEERESGKIKKANGGTLFLNNIDFLPISAQNKLLHFIQEGEINPYGNKIITGINVRIISAATGNLKMLSKKGCFREDLYYCLGVFLIRLPSLWERGEQDIRALAESFCYSFSANENKRIKGLAEEVGKFLLKRSWKGNVRQLRNYIFRAVILCDDGYLEVKHFPKDSELKDEEINYVLSNNNGFEFARYHFASVDLFNLDGKCRTWSEIGQEVVRQLFDIYKGNLSEMSKHLKISRSTVYRKLIMGQNEKN